ncbi:hypothetical protein BCV72DRAFT_211501 [Rhizopus microsporus var. microsporus]|uniref:Uncharacterized protein n=1 Tax=Rhizopus microsporus var. microsporus TaxID=86635 RepID=A0A1X0QX26_RHIZD|nr:hypothetical protein BCV72DRAFT_211501 [Rhizopus microsporus var. microsporus]
MIDKENSKISVDHYERLPGALSMMKTIANECSFGSMKTFKKLKVYFLYTAGAIRLWFIKYIREWPLFELWLEQSLEIKPGFDNRLEQVLYSIEFYWSIKCLVEETVKSLDIFKEDHETFAMQSLLTFPPKETLATAVPCSILQLTEAENKLEMFRLGPFYIL